ncbi:MAG: hypothetical protein KDN22_22365 [Verrucomicrobiae bacterium]|nr:hypothetical protein [Verrucomicrobiae bacterium]
MSQEPNGRNSLWQRIRHAPLALMVAMVVGLYLIGDEYPFSNYPMYSNFDEEALVFFISDENGIPLKMRDVFDKSSSDAKKIYKNHLRRLAKDAKIPDDQEPSLTLKQAAGRSVLDQFLTQHKRPDFADQLADHTALQAHLRRVWLEDGKFHDEFTLLAEEPLK